MSKGTGMGARGWFHRRCHAAPARARTLRMLAPWAMALLSACTSAEVAMDEAPSWSSTDSAGIEIVESLRPAWSEGEAWRLSEEPVLVIHATDGTEENRLLDPVSIDVDRQGRLLVGDGNQVGWNAVLVYDADGEFLFQAGGSGEGPGEFRQLWWAEAYRGDSIVAFDMGGDMLRVFDPQGRYVRQLQTPMFEREQPPRGTYGYTAGADAAYGDGSFLAYPFGLLDIEAGPGPAWYRHLLIRMSPDGEGLDTLGRFEISQQYWDGGQQQSYWFAPVALSAVGEDELWFGTGESFEVRRYDASGTLDRIVRREYQRRPVTEELRAQLLEWYLDRISSSPEVNDEVLERIRRDFETGYVAELLPAYSGMLLDDGGNLWVEEFRWVGMVSRPPDPGPASWSVFDPDGIWLGNVTTPAGFILDEVTEDRALGFMVDDFDVKEVWVYGLEKPGG